MRAPILLTLLLASVALAAPAASAASASGLADVDADARPCDTGTPRDCVPDVWVTSRGEVCVSFDHQTTYYCTPIATAVASAGTDAAVDPCKEYGVCVDVTVDDGEVCVTFSRQVPQCVDTRVD